MNHHVTHAATELGTEQWQKPWSGSNGGQCVETKQLLGGRVALRQSREPDGPALIYSAEEMKAFVAGAKSGQADFLLS
ncbi:MULTISPECIES: DUF397 domain-containing protein [unclassified Streptomyces]|uniref:DUF397 domain-containing protein n=1 Tax=unclassified Streptomyces TaxID=2593676 RepID=UPI0036ABA934